MREYHSSGKQAGFGSTAGRVFMVDCVSDFFLRRCPGVELLGQRAIVVL